MNYVKHTISSTVEISQRYVSLSNKTDEEAAYCVISRLYQEGVDWMCETATLSRHHRCHFFVFIYISEISSPMPSTTVKSYHTVLNVSENNR